MILKKAWKKNRIQVSSRTIYFDHEYATKIVRKHKEYSRIKKILKEKGICFQTLSTNMQIHWDTVIQTYSSAKEAQRELQRRGFRVHELEAPKGETVETRLRGLLGWKQVASQQERNSLAAQRERDKLQKFQGEHTKYI